jgi:tetratricopeptide (TPR) repeat protein
MRGVGPLAPNFFAAAAEAHSLGHLQVAADLYRKVPPTSLEYEDSLISLALICHQTGRFADAAGYFSKLVALRPGDAANHCNLGECLRESGRFDEAFRQLNLGLALDPDQPDAFNSLGLVHHAQRRLPEAEQSIRHALKLRPAFPRAMINLGMVLQERRQLREAADLFRQAIAISPDDPMANSNLGQILIEIGRLDDLEEAEQRCIKAIQLTPNLPQPINNLGNVYRAMSRFDEALECYRKATALGPQLAMPINNMAQALHGRARFDEASELYLKALEMEPLSARLHANYASLLKEQEKLEEAEARYRHALTIEPDHPESFHGLGQIYMQLQQIEQAEAAFRKAIEIDPEITAPRMGLVSLYGELGDFDKADEEADEALKIYPKLAEAYYQRVTHRKGKISDEDLQRMTELEKEKYLGDGARSQLNFAFGTVHDRRKNYAQAGQYFQRGNELQAQNREKRKETYDPATFTSWIDQHINTFSPELFQKFQGYGNPTKRPIFVVGLPRSGTTLVEQILASHPAIHGAGELIHISKIFTDLPASIEADPKDPFAAVSALNPKAISQLTERYLDELSKLDSTALGVVDKMPDNVNMLGFIRLLFPNARVIHCRRDLRDNALSCYQIAFGSIRWANDWTHIARRFRDYLRIVKHWQKLPTMGWLEFPYESVIADLETQARQLIEYVGFDWDPSCLNFHETKRQVRTASVSQVREPIYKTSVSKWQNYEKEITPFLDEMARQGHHFS